MSSSFSAWKTPRPWIIVALVALLIVEAVVIVSAAMARTESASEAESDPRAQTQQLMEGFLRADPAALQVLVGTTMTGLTPEAASIAMGPDPAFSITAEDKQDPASPKRPRGGDIVRNFKGQISTPDGPVEVSLVWSRASESSAWQVKPFQLNVLTFTAGPGVEKVNVNGTELTAKPNGQTMEPMSVFPGKISVTGEALSPLVLPYNKELSAVPKTAVVGRSMLTRSDLGITDADNAPRVVDAYFKRCLGPAAGPVANCLYPLPDRPLGSSDVRNVVFSKPVETSVDALPSVFKPSDVYGQVSVSGEWKINGQWRPFTEQVRWRGELVFGREKGALTVLAARDTLSEAYKSWAQAKTDYGPDGSKDDQVKARRKALGLDKGDSK